ncbi:hypothetical protein FD755_018273 [Muntiacus reevesi]|uniref:Uncharacterized protein n=1 Tax=Muntiacus reevesi TaxID=9886 RepID=A0A5N3X893_MUNRE|nr:hypothetical protein FD755_018273 [Muntiacus reevesi]
MTIAKPLSPKSGLPLSWRSPDYVKDHLPQVAQHTAYIGEKCPALEKTGDLRYLWRPALNRSLPAKYKPEYVGEIGWGIPEYDFINKTRLQTGFHIKREGSEKACLISFWRCGCRREHSQSPLKQERAQSAVPLHHEHERLPYWAGMKKSLPMLGTVSAPQQGSGSGMLLNFPT